MMTILLQKNKIKHTFPAPAGIFHAVFVWDTIFLQGHGFRGFRVPRHHLWPIKVDPADGPERIASRVAIWLLAVDEHTVTN